MVSVGDFGSVPHGPWYPRAIPRRASQPHARRWRWLSCVISQLMGSGLVPRDVIYSFVQVNTRMRGSWGRRAARALADVLICKITIIQIITIIKNNSNNSYTDQVIIINQFQIIKNNCYQIIDSLSFRNFLSIFLRRRLKPYSVQCEGNFDEIIFKILGEL